jgi:septation ring formation regulator EzrA
MSLDQREFEEKICFLEQQVDELRQDQLLQQKAYFQLEQKVQKLQKALQQLAANMKDNDD